MYYKIYIFIVTVTYRGRCGEIIFKKQSGSSIFMTDQETVEAEKENVRKKNYLQGCRS